jgi:hypothetical protein
MLNEISARNHIIKNAMMVITILLMSCIGRVRSFSRAPLTKLKLNSMEALMAASVDPLLSTQENAMINLFERVRPSVVYVSTFIQAFNPLLMNVMEVPSQSGSGNLLRIRDFLAFTFDCFPRDNQYLSCRFCLGH